MPSVVVVVVVGCIIASLTATRGLGCVLIGFDCRRAPNYGWRAWTDECSLCWFAAVLLHGVATTITSTVTDTKNSNNSDNDDDDDDNNNNNNNNKQVVELGSGLGLPGLVAAKFAAETFLSDCAPDVVANLHTAIQLNGLNDDGGADGAGGAGSAQQLVAAGAVAESPKRSCHAVTLDWMDIVASGGSKYWWCVCR